MWKRYSAEKSRLRGLRKARSLLTENENLNIVRAGMSAVRLDGQGPYTIDIDKVMERAAQERLLAIG